MGSLVIALLVRNEAALRVVVGRRMVQAPVFQQQLFSYKIIYERGIFPPLRRALVLAYNGKIMQSERRRISALNLPSGYTVTIPSG